MQLVSTGFNTEIRNATNLTLADQHAHWLSPIVIFTPHIRSSRCRSKVPLDNSEKALSTFSKNTSIGRWSVIRAPFSIRPSLAQAHLRDARVVETSFINQHKFAAFFILSYMTKEPVFAGLEGSSQWGKPIASEIPVCLVRLVQSAAWYVIPRWDMDIINKKESAEVKNHHGKRPVDLWMAGNTHALVGGKHLKVVI